MSNPQETPPDILLIEADESVRAEIFASLAPRWRRMWARTPGEAEVLIEQHRPRLLVCSDDLPSETGLMFLARTQDRWPDMRRILLAPEIDGDLFFLAMSEVTLFHYLTKPVVPSELNAAVARAIATRDVKLAGRPASKTAESAAPLTAPPEVRPGTFALLIAFLLGAVCSLAAFILFYEIKTQLGIDFIPGVHLGDLFK